MARGMIAVFLPVLAAALVAQAAVFAPAAQAPSIPRFSPVVAQTEGGDIGPPPSRSWLEGFGVYVLLAVIAVIAFLLVGAWLVFRWGGQKPLPRHSPHDDIP